jgi:uncharacterized paraquat-inducible protein A
MQTETATNRGEHVCFICQVTVLPADKQLCYRCWRMMRPEERKKIGATTGGRTPEWVDRGHD